MAQNTDVAYSREFEILQRFREITASNELTGEAYSAKVQEFITAYERLLDESQLLTSVGDRLQRKLKATNGQLRAQGEEIRRINGTLSDKNAELQSTIDELTRAKASRRATAYAFVVAIGAFLASELIEISVESNSESYGRWGTVIVWGVKLGLVVLFKPFEQLMEKRFMRAALREKQQGGRTQAHGDPSSVAGPTGLALADAQMPPAAVRAQATEPRPHADDPAAEPTPAERRAAARAAARAKAEAKGDA